MMSTPGIDKLISQFTDFLIFLKKYKINSKDVSFSNYWLGQ